MNGHWKLEGWKVYSRTFDAYSPLSSITILKVTLFGSVVLINKINILKFVFPDGISVDIIYVSKFIFGSVFE